MARYTVLGPHGYSRPPYGDFTAKTARAFTKIFTVLGVHGYSKPWVDPSLFATKPSGAVSPPPPPIVVINTDGGKPHRRKRLEEEEREERAAKARAEGFDRLVREGAGAVPTEEEEDEAGAALLLLA